MTIKEIETLLKDTPVESLQEALTPFRADERTGVKKIVKRYQKKLQDHEETLANWEMRLCFDEVMGEGTIVVGVDEVGRGPLSGPVVAAAVVLPKNVQLLGLRDSKKLTEEHREQLYQEIKEKALAIGVGVVPAGRIDEINILQATFEAMREALSQINVDYNLVLVDGDKTIPNIECMQQAIISGDDKSASIAAASVIAKVTRDRMMVKYNQIYPGYYWDRNKGYGSGQHYEAIREKGITPLHRKTFLKNEGIV